MKFAPNVKGSAMSPPPQLHLWVYFVHNFTRKDQDHFAASVRQKGTPIHGNATKQLTASLRYTRLPIRYVKSFLGCRHC